MKVKLIAIPTTAGTGSEATQFSDQLSLFSKNNGLLKIVGGSVAAFGLIFFIVFEIILNRSFGLAGIAIIAIGLVLGIFTIVKTKKEFGLICKYVSLASDYQSFTSISSHSIEVTQARELAKMKSMGDKPNERKSKLDDDIRMLIPECDKYGFLPVFVCERDTWENETQEKESIYKDIKSLANDAIVIYNGNTYDIAI